MAYQITIREWLDALESGQYQQTSAALCDFNGYCCLGVAADKAGVPRVRDATLRLGIEDEKVYEFSGGFHSNGLWPTASEARLNAISTWKGDDWSKTLVSRLMDMNDQGVPFLEIAAFIRANVPDLDTVIYL